MGPAVIAVKCLQNRWLIHRPHERHYQPRMPRIRQNAKEALRTSEACDARCYRQTQGEKPISLLGVGSGRGAQKLQHDWLAIAVSRLCSFVMIKSQHSQNQHLICVVMWMLRLRKRDHNTNKTNILIRSLMCLFRLHRLNVPCFAEVQCPSLCLRVVPFRRWLCLIISACPQAFGVADPFLILDDLLWRQHKCSPKYLVVKAIICNHTSVLNKVVHT